MLFTSSHEAQEAQEAQEATALVEAHQATITCEVE